MGMSQVRDMNIVTQACAVGSRVVVSKDLKPRPLAESCLGRGLDEMRRLPGALPTSAMGIGPGNVEIPKDYEAQRMSTSHIPKHHLRHQLRCTIRRDRIEGRRFGDRALFGIAVDGSRRRKEDL